MRCLKIPRPEQLAYATISRQPMPERTQRNTILISVAPAVWRRVSSPEIDVLTLPRWHVINHLSSEVAENELPVSQRAPINDHRTVTTQHLHLCLAEYPARPHWSFIARASLSLMPHVAS